MKKEVIQMDDREFIIYLCKQICDIASDGDEPDIETISKELEDREINPDDIFVY